jgi:hypothetical protein
MPPAGPREERQGVLNLASERPTAAKDSRSRVAVATVGDMDVVVSWNFKHIVRLDKIQLFNGVNQEHGYRPLTIYSPREVATHGKED